MSDRENKHTEKKKEKKMNREIMKKRWETQKEKMIKNIKRIRKTG